MTDDSSDADRKTFADPDTEFAIPTSGTPVSEDGYKIGEPLGLVVCEECHREAENIDDIRHKADCSQRKVHSEWYWRTHDSA